MRTRPLFAVLTLVALAAPAASAQDAIDTSFVTRDFLLAVVLRPQQLVERPQIAPFAGELMTQLKANTPIDPKTIDTITVLSTPPAGGDPSEGVAVIARLSAPYPKQDVLALLNTDAAATHAGKTYYPSRQNEDQYVYLPDNKTLVSAQEPVLKRMLELQKPGGPLVEALKNADRKSAVNVVFVMEPVRQMAIGAAQANPPEEPFKAYAKVPELLETAELSLGEKNYDIKLTLRGKDAEGGKKLQALANQGLALARQLIGITAAEQDETVQKLAQSGIRILGGTKVTPTTNGTSILIDGKVLEAEIGNLQDAAMKLQGPIGSSLE